jgi:hypothetical protein
VLALGNVLDDAVHRYSAAAFVAIDFGFHVHDPDLAVGPRNPALELHLPGAGECLAKQHFDARTLVLDDPRPHKPIGQPVILVRQAGDRKAFFRQLHPTRRDVPFPAAKARDALRLGQLSAAFGQFLAHARRADHVAQPLR